MRKKHPFQKIERQGTEIQSCTTSTISHSDNPDDPDNPDTPPSTSKGSNENKPVDNNSESHKRLKSSHLPNISNYFNKPLALKKQKEIDRQLIAMITKEYHPFSIVEDEEFRKLLYLLNPSYKLPTRKTVSQSLIPAIYNETVELVRTRLNRGTAICLTIDGWTSRNNEGFYSITAHYIVENEKGTYLSSDLIGLELFVEKHTVENISKILNEVLQEWGCSNKITAVVTDNAANMKAAVRTGSWRHWGCFAHSLNLVTQTGLKEIQNIVEKVKKIVRFFNKSTFAYEQLKETQKRMELPLLKLKNDVPTRWNSTYDMIRRFLMMKNALIATLAVLNSSTQDREDDIELLTTTEWVVLEQSEKILSIMEVVTTTISSQRNVTMSSLSIYFKKMVQYLNNCKLNPDMKPEAENMRKTLITELNKRFDSIEDNELVTQATILDPRFKKFGFIDEKKYIKAKETLCHRISNISTVTENNEGGDGEMLDKNIKIGNKPKSSDVLWEDFDKEVKQYLRPTNPFASAVVELDKYLDEPLLGRLEDPLVWWNQRKHIYPRLYEMVKRRLCIMATSVPCERIFSHAGQIATEKRERLKTNKISQIVFLNYNMNNSDE